MPTIILDRDGVINHDSEEYIQSPDEWHAIEGSLSAIAKLKTAGYQIAVATNQSGLGRGLFSRLSLCNTPKNDLESKEMGGEFDMIAFCPTTQMLIANAGNQRQAPPSHKCKTAPKRRHRLASG